MIKRALLTFLFLLNVLAIDFNLTSGVYEFFYLLAIYFAVGFLSVFLYAKLGKSLLFLVINVAVAFCMGMAIYGYTILFPNETNFIHRGPFENFQQMCPVALVIGAFGIILAFGIRKFIALINTKRKLP